MSLTHRALALAALVAALGVVGTWVGGGLADAWKAGFAVLALALVYEWVAVNRGWPAVRLGAEAQLRLGARCAVELVFENPSRRDLRIEYVCALPPGVAAPRDNREARVPASAQLSEPVELRATTLGRVHWRRVPVRVLGPLGLARWSRRLPLEAELGVAPDTLGHRGTRSATSERGRESIRQIGGSLELHHLRPYRRGDHRSSIDWKATARSGELITRVFGEDQHLEIVVAIDAGRTSRLETGGMPQFSHYVNLAARFAEYAAIAEDRAGLLVFSDRILRQVAPERGVNGVRQLRRALAGLEPDPVESNLLQAAVRIRELARHRSLVVLLTSLYDRGASEQLARFVRMLSPKHLPMIVGLVSDEVTAAAERPASSWFDPYRSIAANEYRRDLAANAALLTRLGACAVAAEPANLDARVFALYDRLRSRHRI